MWIINKFIFRLKLFLADEHSKANVYAKYLKVNIGENVRITGKPVFGSEPYLIFIGDNVTITDGVNFLTHDGGVGVLRKKHAGINVFNSIHIGCNVFIGTNTIIMPGVTVGDNVVIGAASLVSRDVPNDVVVAGVPAKIIKTLGEYEERALNKAMFLNENDPVQRKDKILKFLNLK